MHAQNLSLTHAVCLPVTASRPGLAPHLTDLGTRVEQRDASSVSLLGGWPLPLATTAVERLRIETILMAAGGQCVTFYRLRPRSLMYLWCVPC